MQGGPDIGGVKAPLANLVEADKAICKEAADMIIGSASTPAIADTLKKLNLI